MITGKCLSLDDNFVPLFRRSIEACHEEMQVCSECLHDSDFVSLSANNFGHCFIGLVIYVYPWCRNGIA